MSDVQPATGVTANSTATAPANAANAANSAAQAGNIPTSYKSLEDFRKKNPKMYDAFMNGIAQSMIQDLKKGADRAKEAMKKNRQNS